MTNSPAKEAPGNIAPKRTCLRAPHKRERARASFDKARRKVGSGSPAPRRRHLAAKRRSVSSAGSNRQRISFKLRSTEVSASRRGSISPRSACADKRTRAHLEPGAAQ